MSSAGRLASSWANPARCSSRAACSHDAALQRLLVLLVLPTAGVGRGVWQRGGRDGCHRHRRHPHRRVDAPLGHGLRVRTGPGLGLQLGQRDQQLLLRVRQRACCRAHGPPWPPRHALLAHLLHPPFLTPACRTRLHNARLLHPPFQRPPAAPALTLPTCRTRLL